ncbi:hypothetical protein D9619_012650 [Psilocybe cf. subviscida]|uniref:Uncharacterized protein n=1 Tax=Psilocybe cf. subviscida TaxID=2480587 RepID=A0A8H5B750_9AGAR|nr:hypothetical protein D9619_012650 [Psilocybe cf. subviscida]
MPQSILHATNYAAQSQKQHELAPTGSCLMFLQPPAAAVAEEGMGIHAIVDASAGDGADDGAEVPMIRAKCSI